MKGSGQHAEITRQLRSGLLSDPAAKAALEAVARASGLVGGGEIEWSVPPRGRRTAIFMGADPDGGRAVVRLAATPGELVRAVWIARHLERLGLPVPSVVHWSAATRWGPLKHYTSVESFVPGRSAVDLIREEGATDEQRRHAVAACGRALAAMHSHTRRRPGPVGVPGYGAYVDRYVPQVKARLERLAGRAPKRLLKEVLEGLDATGGRLAKRDRYELIHGRVYPNNVLVAGDDVHLVDLGSAHYGDAGRDLVRGLVRICHEEQPLQDVFEAEYFDHVQGFDRDDFAQQAPFYWGELYATRATGPLRRYRDGDIDEVEMETQVAEQLERAVSALEWRPDA